MRLVLFISFLIYVVLCVVLGCVVIIADLKSNEKNFKPRQRMMVPFLVPILPIMYVYWYFRGDFIKKNEGLNTIKTVVNSYSYTVPIIEKSTIKKNIPVREDVAPEKEDYLRSLSCCNAADIMLHSLLNNEFYELEKLLDDNSVLTIYRHKTIFGKHDIITYWKDWLVRYDTYIKSAKLTKIFGGNYMRYGINILFPNSSMCIYFREEFGKIADMVFISQFSAESSNDSFYKTSDIPYSVAFFEQYMGNSITAPSHTTPCLKCGCRPSGLQWRSFKYSKGNDYRHDEYTGEISICTKCNRIVDLYTTNHVCDNTISVRRGPNYKPDLSKYEVVQENILVDKAGEFFSIIQQEYYISYVHEPSKIWNVLDKVSLPQKFELCFKVNHVKHHNHWISRLAHLFISDDETKDIYNIKDVIFVSPDIMGAWQAYLLINSNSILCERYPRYYIFTSSDIYSINRLKHLDFTDLQSNKFIEPAVEIIEQGENTIALISCLYWCDERLYREVVRMKIINRRIVSYKQLQILKIYDSGIRTYF